MIKGIVFFDLDGTLLNDNADVNPNVIQAIEKLKGNGYLPIIATGRSVVEVEHILDKTAIHSIISMNGQLGILNGETIFEKIIDRNTMVRLREMVASRNEEIAFYNRSNLRVTGHNETVKRAYDVIHSPVPAIDSEMYKKANINMALILTETGDELYRNEFPELSFIRNSPYSMDVICAGGSKATGIKTFLNVLQMEDVPTFAFGDGYNDFEMFDAVDYRIAMGNAVKPLKEKATYVTETNTRNGIVQGLKHYQLI